MHCRTLGICKTCKRYPPWKAEWIVEASVKALPSLWTALGRCVSQTVVWAFENMFLSKEIRKLEHERWAANGVWGLGTQVMMHFLRMPMVSCQYLEGLETLAPGTTIYPLMSTLHLQTRDRRKCGKPQILLTKFPFFVYLKALNDRTNSFSKRIVSRIFKSCRSWAQKCTEKVYRQVLV